MSQWIMLYKLKSYTTTERDALSSPVAGDMIYNTTDWNNRIL